MTSDTSHRPDGPRPEIVVGYDGSSSSKSAVRTAVTLAESLRADLRLISTWMSPISIAGYAYSGSAQEEESRQVILEVTRDLFEGHVPGWFTTESLEGSAAQTLIAQSARSGMLVLGSRGHGGFAGLLLGSVSTECASHAKCPVLIVRHDAPSVSLFDTSAIPSEVSA